MSHRREINQANPTAIGINNGDLLNADILDHLTQKLRSYYLKPKTLRTGKAMLIAGQRTKPSTYGKLKTGNFKQKFEATYIKQILKIKKYPS